MKKYINTHDFQGETWFLGFTGTIKDWKELALEWCDLDENVEVYNYIYNHKADKELLNFINEVWSINIVEFDKNNKEHIDLKERRF